MNHPLGSIAAYGKGGHLQIVIHLPPSVIEARGWRSGDSVRVVQVSAELWRVERATVSSRGRLHTTSDRRNGEVYEICASTKGWLVKPTEGFGCSEAVIEVLQDADALSVYCPLDTRAPLTRQGGLIPVAEVAQPVIDRILNPPSRSMAEAPALVVSEVGPDLLRDCLQTISRIESETGYRLAHNINHGWEFTAPPIRL